MLMPLLKMKERKGRQLIFLKFSWEVGVRHCPNLQGKDRIYIRRIHARILSGCNERLNRAESPERAGQDLAPIFGFILLFAQFHTKTEVRPS